MCHVASRARTRQPQIGWRTLSRMRRLANVYATRSIQAAANDITRVLVCTQPRGLRHVHIDNLPGTCTLQIHLSSYLHAGLVANQSPVDCSHYKFTAVIHISLKGVSKRISLGIFQLIISIGSRTPSNEVVESPQSDTDCRTLAPHRGARSFERVFSISAIFSPFSPVSSSARLQAHFYLTFLSLRIVANQVLEYSRSNRDRGKQETKILPRGRRFSDFQMCCQSSSGTYIFSS